MISLSRAFVEAIGLAIGLNLGEIAESGRGR
jgi:hypothetical protein